jgi:hypothetical protein
VAISWGSCGSQSDPPFQRMDENTRNVLAILAKRSKEADKLSAKPTPPAIHNGGDDPSQPKWTTWSLGTATPPSKDDESENVEELLGETSSVPPKEIKTMTSTNKKKKKKASASNATPTPEKSARRKRNDLFLNPWPKDVEGKLHNRVRAAVHGGMKRLGRLARQQLKFRDDNLDRDEFIVYCRRALRVTVADAPDSYLDYVFDVIDEKSGIGMIKIIDLVKFAGCEVPGSSPRAQTVLSPEASGSVKAGSPTSHPRKLHINNIMDQAEELAQQTAAEALVAQAAADRAARRKRADEIIDARKRERTKRRLKQELEAVRAVEQSLMYTNDLAEALRHMELRQWRIEKERADAEVAMMEAEDELGTEVRVVVDQADWLAHASTLFALRHGRELPFDASISVKQLRRALNDTAGKKGGRIRPTKKAFADAEQRIVEDRAHRKKSVFDIMAEHGDRIFLDKFLAHAPTFGIKTHSEAVKIFEHMDQARIGFVTREDWDRVAFVCLDVGAVSTAESDYDSKRLKLKILKATLLTLPRNLTLYMHEKEHEAIAREDAHSKKAEMYRLEVEEKREKARLEDERFRRLRTLRAETYTMMTEDSNVKEGVPKKEEVDGWPRIPLLPPGTPPSPQIVAAVATQLKLARRAQALDAAKARSGHERKALTERIASWREKGVNGSGEGRWVS